ncbi:MAG TPA: permease, partial [Candidatus Dojkabacteria bacterium]|nr:permease [Candidatus Dojkabacteria bacterium]
LLFPSIFGWETTLVYNLIGIGISILGGLLIEKINLIKFVNQDLIKIRTSAINIPEKKAMSLKERMKFFWKDGFVITKQVFPYVVLGVFIGALIHGLIPQELIEDTLATKQWWAVPIATLLGIPLYANSVSVIPIAEALIGKGIPLGTILSFMTATVTLSIPEALILKKAMKWQLLAIFFAITTIGIMLMGYIFNLRG